MIAGVFLAEVRCVHLILDLWREAYYLERAGGTGIGSGSVKLLG